MGPLTDEECDFICFLCECWDVRNEDFLEEVENQSLDLNGGVTNQHFQQILWQLYYEIPDHHRYICVALHFHDDRCCK